jgi:hypothetical protein
MVQLILAQQLMVGFSEIILHMGGFAENIGNKSAFLAELSGVIKAIEIAYENHWLNFWLETDSVLVVKAFSNLSLIPWSLRNRRMNCLLMTRNMNFFVSDVYREGNVCAYVLANLGLGLLELTFWNIAHLPICKVLLGINLVCLISGLVPKRVWFDPPSLLYISLLIYFGGGIS